MRNTKKPSKLMNPTGAALFCLGSSTIEAADTNATILAHLGEDGGLTAGVFPNDISMTADIEFASHFFPSH